MESKVKSSIKIILSQQECIELLKKFNAFDIWFCEQMIKIERYEEMQRRDNIVQPYDSIEMNKRVCYVLSSKVFDKFLSRLKVYVGNKIDIEDELPL